MTTTTTAGVAACDFCHEIAPKGLAYSSYSPFSTSILLACETCVATLDNEWCAVQTDDSDERFLRHTYLGACVRCDTPWCTWRGGPEARTTHTHCRDVFELPAPEMATATNVECCVCFEVGIDLMFAQCCIGLMCFECFTKTVHANRCVRCASENTSFVFVADAENRTERFLKRMYLAASVKCPVPECAWTGDPESLKAHLMQLDVREHLDAPLCMEDAVYKISMSEDRVRVAETMIHTEFGDLFINICINTKLRSIWKVEAIALSVLNTVLGYIADMLDIVRSEAMRVALSMTFSKLINNRCCPENESSDIDFSKIREFVRAAEAKLDTDPRHTRLVELDRHMIGAIKAQS